MASASNIPQADTAVFWDWSLAAYARPGAAAALLALQDRAGLNVNLLLWSCWTATRFEAAPESAIRTAMDAIDAWNRTVTQALRRARRAAKPFADQPGFAAAEKLRNDIKTAELAAERIEIERLDALAAQLLTPASGEDAERRARRNLVAYAALAGAAKQDGFSTALLHDLIGNILAPSPPDGRQESEATSP